MQYVTEILIKKPVSEVIKNLNSTDKLKHWQDDLVSTEHISGVPSQLGAKMRLNYSFGKRKMEIIKMITHQNFPSEFHVTYTTKGVRNIQGNFYKTTEDGYTKWISENELQPTNLKMSMMLFFMPSAFKKQTKSYMANFKNFIENGTSVHRSN